LGRVLFQGFVESDLLLLLFVQRQSWCRSRDRCTISRCCWLLCFIGDLVVLSQVLFFRPGAYWLRSCGLCHEGKLLLRTVKRNYHYHVTILCKGDNIASFAFELELTRLPLLIYDYAWMYQHDLSRFGGQRDEALSLLLFSQQVDDFGMRLTHPGQSPSERSRN